MRDYLRSSLRGYLRSGLRDCLVLNFGLCQAPDDVRAGQQPPEGDADAYRAHDPPPADGADALLDPVLRRAIDAVRPAVASFPRHYIHAPVRQKHGACVRLRLRCVIVVCGCGSVRGRRRIGVGGVGPREAHDAAAAEAHADDAVAEAVEQVDVRRDALAGAVEVEDDLARARRAGCVREQQGVCLWREQRAEMRREGVQEVCEEGGQAACARGDPCGVSGGACEGWWRVAHLMGLRACLRG